MFFKKALVFLWHFWFLPLGVSLVWFLSCLNTPKFGSIDLKVSDFDTSDDI